jgi:hypothetical protein
MDEQQQIPPIDPSNGLNPGSVQASGATSDPAQLAGPQADPLSSGLPATHSTGQVPPVAVPQPITPNIGNKFSSESPAVAEDVDLIEKEWVNKAKSIVEKTKNDPSQQNIELNRFKADYLNARFSKNIKPMDS